MLVIVAVAVMSSLLTEFITNRSWMTDCTLAGVHVYRDVAYKCEPVKGVAR